MKPYDVTIKIGEKEFSGTFRVEKGMVKVTSPWGSKATQKGGSDSDLVAERLLRDIVRESGRADKND